MGIRSAIEAEAIYLKRLLCLALILALSVPMLAGCGALRARRAQRAAEDANAPDSEQFEPENGPGYVITDASDPQEATVDPDSGLGNAQPTPEPLETLAPEGSESVQDAGDSSDETDDSSIVVDGDGMPFNTYDENAAASSHTGNTAVYDTSAFQYSAVMDNNLDYTFNYPSDWENVPGIYTVCFREKVEPGDFPARVAITRKRLVHTPDDAALMSQLSSYMRAIYQQYDASTFQVGTPDRAGTFMGTKAFSNTYLAYWGDVEVKGYVIGCAIERTMYVFHFCASYYDYVAYQNVMQYIRNSVKRK